MTGTKALTAGWLSNKSYLGMVRRGNPENCTDAWRFDPDGYGDVLDVSGTILGYTWKILPDLPRPSSRGAIIKWDNGFLALGGGVWYFNEPNV